MHISIHNSFMLTPIDLVMVLKESSFKELSNDILFVQVLYTLAGSGLVRVFTTEGAKWASVGQGQHNVLRDFL